MKTIAVIGGGVTGVGIAAICLISGYRAIVFVRNPKKIPLIKSRISELAFGHEAHLIVTAMLSDISSAYYVIEAVAENLYVKQSVYKALESLLDIKTIIATNTSSLSPRVLSSKLKHPGRFIAFHFFNPVVKMPLVEIMCTPFTNSRSVRLSRQLAMSLGKQIAFISKESDGYIVNRLLFAFITEALKLHHEGITTPKEIDRAIELGLRHPMGPFKLIDLIGLDITHDILRNLSRVNKWNSPMSDLTNRLRRKHLGRKSGKGYYNYKS